MQVAAKILNQSDFFLTALINSSSPQKESNFIPTVASTLQRIYISGFKRQKFKIHAMEFKKKRKLRSSSKHEISFLEKY